MAPEDPEAIAFCLVMLREGGTPVSANAQVLDTVRGGEGVSQALTVAATLNIPGRAELFCTNNGAPGNLSVRTYNFNAVRVTSLQNQ